MKVIPETRRMN